MVRHRFAVFLIIGLLSFSASTVAKAATAEGPVKSPNSPTSAELVTQPKRWDGKRVTFTGEAITEALERGDYAWIHLNDDAYHLRNVEEGAQLGGMNSGHAVWLPIDLAEKVRHFGDYTHQGDVVRVTGTFNAACGQHGGDMDIHGASLEVLKEGRLVHEPVKPLKLGLAVVLAVIAGRACVGHRRAQVSVRP